MSGRRGTRQIAKHNDMRGAAPIGRKRAPGVRSAQMQALARKVSAIEGSKIAAIGSSPIAV